MTKQRSTSSSGTVSATHFLGCGRGKAGSRARSRRCLRERPDAATAAQSIWDILGDYDVDLTWFNSAESAYAAFGQLNADYEGKIRFTQSVEEIGAAVQDADFLVLHKQPLPGEYISSAPKLKLIQHLGQDYRGVPMDAARARGSPSPPPRWSTTSPWRSSAGPISSTGVNGCHRCSSRWRVGRYVDQWGLFPDTHYLGDLTLGLLGLGEIARPIARVAQAFDMPTLYWDIQRFPDLEERYDLTYVSWDELFSRSDIVTTQLALNDQTEGIIGAREFDLMKPTALFINTARGNSLTNQR